MKRSSSNLDSILFLVSILLLVFISCMKHPKCQTVGIDAPNPEWVIIDGKYYKKEKIQSLGIFDILTAIANVASNVINSNNSDEMLLEKAEAKHIRNNRSSTRQLVSLRKKWEKDKLTFFEYMNRRADLLHMTVKDLFEAELELNNVAKIELYKN